uniref:Uncharacterized protein n=1 Tax=Callorhinchus milii TaxID=7868 RepID=A0A4W3GQE0_CALMI
GAPSYTVHQGPSRTQLHQGALTHTATPGALTGPSHTQLYQGPLTHTAAPGAPHTHSCTRGTSHAQLHQGPLTHTAAPGAPHTHSCTRGPSHTQQHQGPLTHTAAPGAPHTHSCTRGPCLCCTEMLKVPLSLCPPSPPRYQATVSCRLLLTILQCLRVKGPGLPSARWLTHTIGVTPQVWDPASQ